MEVMELCGNLIQLGAPGGLVGRGVTPKRGFQILDGSHCLGVENQIRDLAAPIQIRKVKCSSIRNAM